MSSPLTTWKGSPREAIQHASSWWPSFHIGHTFRSAVIGVVALSLFSLAFFSMTVGVTLIFAQIFPLHVAHGSVHYPTLLTFLLVACSLGFLHWRTPEPLLASIYRDTSPRHLTQPLRHAQHIALRTLCPYADPLQPVTFTRHDTTSWTTEMTLRGGAHITFTAHDIENISSIHAELTLPPTLPSAAVWRPSTLSSTRNPTIKHTRHRDGTQNLALRAEIDTFQDETLLTLLSELLKPCCTYTQPFTHASDTTHISFKRLTPAPPSTQINIQTTLAPNTPFPLDRTHAHTRAIVVWNTTYRAAIAASLGLCVLSLSSFGEALISTTSATTHGRPSPTAGAIFALTASLASMLFFLHIRRFDPRNALSFTDPQTHPPQTLTLRDTELCVDEVTIRLDKPFTLHLSQSPSPPDNLWLHLSLHQDKHTIALRTHIADHEALSQTLPRLHTNSPILDPSMWETVWPVIALHADMHGVHIPWGRVQQTHQEHAQQHTHIHHLHHT